jgi:hypothetical protein
LLHRSGEAWLKAGRPQHALSLLERAVEIAPDHEPSRRALALARQRDVRDGAPSGSKNAAD